VAGLVSLVLVATPVGAGDFTLDGRTFTLPEGFTIETVAGPPLVDRPIVADFDERGRLYVADSSGSNDPVQKQLAEKPHRILRLEDADGDGRFDKRTVFADRMMFPEGTLWHDGSLYVSAPPQIWKLTDTDDDGVADRREVWFDGKTLTGCANDLHGPYLGPDGLIYWCKGAFAEQTYERPGGKPPLVTRASHIFRRRPDEAGFVEPVMTGGMDNPVDVVFTPGGERIFTTTFLQNPAGGRRDGLIHAIYGGVYGKVHNVIDDHVRTMPDVMPVLSHLGPAAPAGLARFESGAFGPDYRDNLFAALFNLHKVTRHVLTPSGATFQSRDEDFLACDSVDFHPTDVLEDADGSLLVVNTGGWYKLCCPTSQLHKPDVLGAIYRIRREGAAKVEDPWGLALDWSKLTPAGLARLLGDDRPAVRSRALGALAARGSSAIPALADILDGPAENRAPTVARENAAWVAGRIDDPQARALVREALGDPEATVRQAALNTISLHRDGEAVAGLIAILNKEDSGLNRRVAAEALGRIGNPSAVPHLLEAAGKAGDEVMAHAATYALIEIGDAGAIAAGLEGSAPGTRRAAMIALDQLGGDRLDPRLVASLLSSEDAGLKQAASWILGRHPEWGDRLAGDFRERLARPDLTEAQLAETEAQLARLAGSASIQGLVADQARGRSTPTPRRISALRAMAASGPRPVPASWVAAVAEALGEEEPPLVAQAVSTARALNVPPDAAGDLASKLVAVADSPGTPESLRLEALAAVPGGLGEVGGPTFAFLVSEVDPERPVSARLAAADVLAKAKLSSDQLLALTDTLASSGPLEVDRLLPAYEKTDDPKVGLRLVEALERSPALASLRVETLRPKLERFGEAVAGPSGRLYAAIEASRANESTRLEELLSTLPTGEIRRGQAVFNGPKAACATCHAIGYLGGKVGPDLTRIGQIRSERDLLESIAFPSASFVRSYEPMAVATRDGRIFSGLLRQDSAAEVVLVTGADQEARIPRPDVEEMRPGTVSVMPAGLDQQLTKQELADLIAFLKACR
jgi:putative membrane-bound dehydrogenase-like protein